MAHKSLIAFALVLCTASWLWAQGRPVITGQSCGGDLGGTFPNCTVTGVQTNSVALGTDTTGNYAAGDAEGGAATSLAPGASDTVDVSGALSSIPHTLSTSLPGTCTEGQMHQDTDSGSMEVYLCTATNNWKQFGDISGVLGDFTGGVMSFWQTAAVFGAADTTPDVSAQRMFRSGGAVTITDFDDGTDHTGLQDGRELLIMAQHAFTLDCSASQINCDAGQDYTAVVGDLVYCVFDDTVDADGQWVCKVRHTDPSVTLDEVFDNGTGEVDGATSSKKFCVGDGTRKLCIYGDATDGVVTEATPAQDAVSKLSATTQFIVRTSGDVDSVVFDNDAANLKAPYAVVTKSTATSYTIGTTDARESYGGVVYVTGAATITMPAVVDGMNFTVITIGAVAVSVDTNASDRMYLDGTALDDGDKATNTSTTGDLLTCAYESAAGWYCASGSNDGTLWTDGGA